MIEAKGAVFAKRKIARVMVLRGVNYDSDIDKVEITDKDDKAYTQGGLTAVIMNVSKGK